MSHAALLSPVPEAESVRLARMVSAAGGLTGRQKLVLVMLVTCAAETSRRPHVPLTDLARYIGCSPKVTLATVSQLEARGLVRVVLREVGRGQRKLRPAVYEVNVPALAALRRPGASI